MFKKEKFPIVVFITSSILALFVLVVFYFFIGIDFRIKRNYAEKPNFLEYYVDMEGDQKNDPYLTKNPNLEDMLAGPIISSSDPWLGDADALVSIVEFSDYECSYCHRQEQILTEILQKYDKKIRLIWKDYPEKDQSSASFQAATAARCAQDQDKFWPYHDLLFNSKQELNRKTFLEIADTLNLDQDSFKKCLNGDLAQNFVKDNIIEANALNITGVPFIYVNDQEVMGEATIEDLERLIEIELGE